MTSFDFNLAKSTTPDFVCGNGPIMRSLNAVVAEIAPTGIPVLILGECGTGKDTYARFIHRLSLQTETAFHRIDCASLESADLARQTHSQPGTGRSEKDRGTLYLDGVQDLDLQCQRALLSHLSEDDDNARIRRMRPRLVSSTNTGLEFEVERGRFRGELYFRINGASVHLPPLRERKDDIPDLLECFLRKHGGINGKAIPTVGRSARELLLAYSWPGNIRQLENTALKILALGETRALDELHSFPSIDDRPDATAGVRSLKVAVRAASLQTERELIIQALEKTRWNRKRAAEELHISYKSFLNKLKAIEASGGSKFEGGKR